MEWISRDEAHKRLGMFVAMLNNSQLAAVIDEITPVSCEFDANLNMFCVCKKPNSRVCVPDGIAGKLRDARRAGRDCVEVDGKQWARCKNAILILWLTSMFDARRYADQTFEVLPGLFVRFITAQDGYFVAQV